MNELIDPPVLREPMPYEELSRIRLASKRDLCPVPLYRLVGQYVRQEGRLMELICRSNFDSGENDANVYRANLTVCHGYQDVSAVVNQVPATAATDLSLRIDPSRVDYLVRWFKAQRHLEPTYARGFALGLNSYSRRYREAVGAGARPDPAEPALVRFGLYCQRAFNEWQQSFRPHGGRGLR